MCQREGEKHEQKSSYSDRKAAPGAGLSILAAVDDAYDKDVPCPPSLSKREQQRPYGKSRARSHVSADRRPGFRRQSRLRD
jgi:hypothetical protein